MKNEKRIGAALLLVVLIVMIAWMRGHENSHKETPPSSQSVDRRPDVTRIDRSISPRNHEDPEVASGQGTNSEVLVLHVIVLRAGDPVGSAAVSVQGAVQVSTSGMGGTASGATDEHGKCTLTFNRETDVRVCATKDRLSAAISIARASPREVSVTLDLLEPAVVNGRVINDANSGVPAAIVRGFVRDNGQVSQLETVSDADGRFVFPLVKVDSDRMPAFIDILVIARGYPRAFLRLSRSQWNRSESVVRLHAAACLRGRVVSSDRNPLGAIVVCYSDYHLMTITDNAGEFELPLSGKEQEILAGPRSLHVGSWVLQGEIDSRVAPQVLGKFRSDVGDVNIGDVVLTAGTVASGTVVDSDGAPIGGAHVAVLLHGSQVFEVASSNDGTFNTPPLSQDAYDISAEEISEGNGWHSRSARLTGVHGGDRALRAVIRGGNAAIIHFVDAASGIEIPASTLPNVLVNAVRSGAPDDSWGWSAKAERTKQLRLPVDAPGVWDFAIVVDGYATFSVSGVEITSDKDGDVRVALRKVK